MEHMVCLRCDTANSGYWVQNGKNDYLDFTTNRDCNMLGINVFGSNTYSGKHDIIKVLCPFMLSLIVYLVFFFTRRGFPKITGNIFCPFSEYKTVFIDLNKRAY
jgi:hypothetical protein